jgi:hypothetical protein
MTKRILALFLAALMLVPALAACGEDKPSTDTTASNDTSDVTPEDTTTAEDTTTEEVTTAFTIDESGFLTDGLETIDFDGALFRVKRTGRGFNAKLISLEKRECAPQHAHFALENLKNLLKKFSDISLSGHHRCDFTQHGHFGIYYRLHPHPACLTFAPMQALPGAIAAEKSRTTPSQEARRKHK